MKRLKKNRDPYDPPLLIDILWRLSLKKNWLVKHTICKIRGHKLYSTGCMGWDCYSESCYVCGEFEPCSEWKFRFFERWEYIQWLIIFKEWILRKK